MTSAGPTLIAVTVVAAEELAKNTKLYVLQADRELPPASAGAHIDLHLASGLVRQYSLVIKEPSLRRYAIAIKRDENSRGGSSFIHDKVKVGDTLPISAPRNNFPLDETAGHTVFVAGGIGITPIYSMLHRLQELKGLWRLYYACRSKEDAAFHGELAEYSGVQFHFDDESEGRFFDVKQVFVDCSPATEFYCCGPSPMMASFEKEAELANISERNVHLEYFTAKEPITRCGAFTVRLARNGKVLNVPEGRSILDVLVEAGIEVEHSCSEGICGTCETRVLSGIPDHHDSILTADERNANNTMMVCCSRSKSPELVLDL